MSLAEEILEEFNEDEPEEKVTVETIDALLKELEEIRDSYRAVNRHINQAVNELDAIDEEIDKVTILINDLAIKVKEEL